MNQHIGVRIPGYWIVILGLVSLMVFGSITFLGYTTYRLGDLQCETARAVRASMMLQKSALDAMGEKIDGNGNSNKVQ